LGAPDELVEDYVGKGAIKRPQVCGIYKERVDVVLSHTPHGRDILQARTHGHTLSERAATVCICCFLNMVRLQKVQEAALYDGR